MTPDLPTTAASSSAGARSMLTVNFGSTVRVPSASWARQKAQASGPNCCSEPVRPTRRRCVGFFCAVGPLILKPSSDFASVARRGLGAVNVSRNHLFKVSFTKKLRALRGRHAPGPRRLARQYPHRLAIHRLATRQRHQHFTLCHHCNIHQHPRHPRCTY
jgi:hypothetical protein